jgi:hypothetical protein
MLAVRCPYNSGMLVSIRRRSTLAFLFAGIFVHCAAAQTPAGNSARIASKELPKAMLWAPYRFQLEAAGGIEPYRWRIEAGPMPRGVKLDGHGELSGEPQETGQFDLTVVANDSSEPPVRFKKRLSLAIEVPLTAEWGRRAEVSGNRIDGSVKVSNRTGRSFDLTVVVLAVNDIGRATAIGYQHFDLKKDTRDQEIPFGETLSPGNYAVNVDVVGEEPISNRIFRARLVTGKEAVTQGP